MVNVLHVVLGLIVLAGIGWLINLIPRNEDRSGLFEVKKPQGYQADDKSPPGG